MIPAFFARWRASAMPFSLTSEPASISVGLGWSTHTISVSVPRIGLPVAASFDASTAAVCPPEQPADTLTFFEPVIDATTSSAFSQAAM